MLLFFLIFFITLVVFTVFFTIAEINYIEETLNLKNTKYIILLRVLETMTPFVTLVIVSGPRAILRLIFPVFCLLCFTYIIILIIEFFRKKINMRELIINSVFCFIDVSLVIIGLVVIFRF